MDSPRQPDPLALNLPPTESPFFERFLSDTELEPAQRKLLRDFRDQGYLVFDLELPNFDALAHELIGELAPRYPDGPHRRVEEAWLFSNAARSIAASRKVLELLELLYRRRPIPFQTLHFDRGTQQAAHSDTLHFHCVPRRYMCGVWVALEDIHPDSGPLVVYPGSHLEPEWDMYDLGLDTMALSPEPPGRGL